MLRPVRALALAMALAALPTPSPVDAADHKSLPDDSEIILTINVKQILDSDLAKAQQETLDQFKDAVKKSLSGDSGAQKYLEKIGFDPFKDCSSITMAMPPGKDAEKMFLLLEGKFNADKIQTTAEEIAKESGDVLKITRSGKFQVYKIAPPNEKPVHAVLLNETTLAVCQSEEGIKSAMSRADGKKSILKKELASLLATTSPKQSFSLVATGTALAKLMDAAPVPNTEQAAQMLKDVSGLTAGVTLGKDIQLQFGVAMKDADAAKQAVAGAGFGLTMVRTLMEQKAKEDEKLKPLADVTKTLKATAEGDTVFLRGAISAANLEKLIKNFKP